ncbi:hypothetical protein [Pyrococcus abyssi]|uniref:Uncharacterized protein n=1 Tax=Pyrococcus abyssi (strain GE5 / Orsay) TaxID=272844 RepID=Q9V100_PYRAB|nr:hypothetical protein [Pyrococcus abyssi]CAB49551.1 Hypothetical protein PAB0433 [Pyrococcus abyssi GE5]CCE70023.1 TPA: hypothetical protein PAB0433 [Pyrococcus abyssi GE5]
MKKGLFLYFLGLGLAIVKPPVVRLACMDISTGRVLTDIDPFFLVIELGFIFVGSYLMALSHKFKSVHAMNGFIALASGIGAAFVGFYSDIFVLALFGAVLATIGLITYKLSRWFS